MSSEGVREAVVLSVMRLLARERTVVDLQDHEGNVYFVGRVTFRNVDPIYFCYIEPLDSDDRPVMLFDWDIVDIRIWGDEARIQLA